MGCFCHQTVAALEVKLQALAQVGATAGGAASAQASLTAQAQASLTAAASASLSPAAQQVAALAAWLAARGLPAPAWQPDPAWLGLKLPTPQLTPEAMATISALATLRQEAMAAFGIDLLLPQQATPFARIVATLNARLTAGLGAGSPLNASAWLSLAAQAEAAASVQAAVQAHLFTPSPAMMLAYSQPAGVPMRQWLALLRQVRALAPLIAAVGQLGLSLASAPTLAVRLAEAIRTLRGISLPPLTAPTQAAQLTAMLSATVRLQASLGVNPTQFGFAAVQQMVAAKVTAAAQLVATLPQPLPDLPYCPASFAPPDVLKILMSEAGQALAAINWNVPPASALSVLQAGLPACALSKQLTAMLGGPPIRLAPCGQGCDAAKIMRAVA